ncbi:MAG: hypothetical protein J7L38_05800 [Thermoproteales archaeon]|nr:hypothetical protein [Thermoproteales archaeon]
MMEKHSKVKITPFSRLKGLIKRNARVFLSSRRSVAVILIVVLISVTLLSFPWVFTEASFKFLLEIHVVRGGEHVPALVYVKALYPEGQRFIGFTRAVSGVAWIWVDHGSWKRAWDNERATTGFHAKPSFIVVVFTEDGYVDVKGFVLEWRELKPYLFGGKKNVIIEPRLKRVRGKPIKVAKPAQASIIPLLDRFLQPSRALDGKAVLVDYYEAERRVNLGKIYFDPNIGEGYGSLFIGYYQNFKVGISLAFTLLTADVWSINFDFVSIGSSSPGSDKAIANSSNPSGYISILVRYRYERWRYYENGELIDESFEMWIKNFYPNTIKAERGQDVSIYSWETKYSGCGKGWSEPTYSEYDFQVDGTRFSVDLLWFANLLGVLKKIPEALESYAGWFTLFVSLNAYQSGALAFAYDLEYIASSNIQVKVVKGKHKFEGNPYNLYNALYWKILKV